MPNNYPNKPSASSSLSSASSSTVTSWILSKDSKQDAPDHQALLSTGSIEGGGGVGRLASDDYMDVMEELGDTDLLVWDPSTLFPCDGMEDIDFDINQNEESAEEPMVNRGTTNTERQENEKPSEDLAMVFLEWLKSNKESISAEDLRNVKLKRSTIECAAKRLDGGKQGMKQLLKLILEWVQNHKLQKKRMKEGENSSLPTQVVLSTKHVYNNGASILPVSPTFFNHQTLIPQGWPLPPHNYSSSTANYYAFTDPDQSSHHVVQIPQLQPTTYTPFGNPYQCQLYPTAGGDSATKEARKKRMARQKRFFSQSQQHQQTNETRLASDANCTTTRRNSNILSGV